MHMITNIKNWTPHFYNDKSSLYQWITPLKGDDFCQVFSYMYISRKVR